jgi:peptidoglycan glycosyltransferase
MLVSLRAAYWQLWRGVALDPVALNPVQAARAYAELRGDPPPGQGSEASSLAQLPQPVIQRTVQLLSTIQRGAILDRRGNLLAEDAGQPGSYTRVYSDPSLAQTIGYASALRTGVTGLEATYNRDLLGLDRPDTEIDRLLHRPIRGSNLVLTIDSTVQSVAAQELAGRAGSVIALDAKTGAVLALASGPTFDPNRINEPGYAASLQGSTALLNHATQALYTPGSIFKTVTLIAAYDTRLVNAKTVFDFGEPKTRDDGKIYYTYTVNGGVIYDPNHKESKLSLQMCYVTSANIAFAKMAEEMDPNTYINYGQRLGFSTADYAQRFPLELPVAEPQLANDLDSIRNDALLRASTGYGQGEALTTPINMAMVVEAVVNGGSIPVPYLVESIRDPHGNIIRARPNNHTVRGVMSANTAKFVRDSMTTLVTHYWKDNFVPGAISGGKTGTAQLGGELSPHAWFIGFAQKGNKTVVVVVVIENGGGGSVVAVPVFQKVAAAALASQ